jgi:hypothetical protein
MIRTQEMKIENNIELSDIYLDKNKEIEISADISKEIGETKYIRLTNVDGKIVIFIENPTDVIIKKWDGYKPYKKIVRDIAEEMEGLIYG